LAGASGGDATAGGAAARGATAPAGAASGAAAGGRRVLESPSVPLRLPNTTALPTGQLTLTAVSRSVVKGTNLAAFWSRRAEHLRIERYRHDRLALDRFGEFARVDFRPLGNADLVEAVERYPVVGPGRLQQIEDILGV